MYEDADEYAEQVPTIGYCAAVKFTGKHLADPAAELATAIAEGDVIEPQRNQIDTASFLAWLGY